MKHIWLALVLPGIATLHAAAFVWLYGHHVDAEALLVLSWLAAFLAYTAAVYSSTLFGGTGSRPAKVTALSLLLSFVSTGIGAMIAFNTYGT